LGIVAETSAWRLAFGGGVDMRSIIFAKIPCRAFSFRSFEHDDLDLSSLSCAALR